MVVKKTVVIMAGGTGGHVIPALEVANVFQQNGYQVVWFGTKHGIEAHRVPQAGFPLVYLAMKGVRKSSYLARLCSPFILTRAMVTAFRALLHVKPVMVLGFGGYASAPGGFAAAILRIPLILHEQNAVAGKTNQYLSRFAKKMLTAFPDTQKLDRAVVLGNPVRSTIGQKHLPIDAITQRFDGLAQQHQDRVNVLVLGGSGGALQLNERVPSALKALGDVPISVLHQSGKKTQAVALERYQDAQFAYVVEPFIETMDQAYAWADLIICRSGAMTVFEVMASSKAAIFIPYPFAVDDHQTHNARYLAEHNAAILLHSRPLDTKALQSAIYDLINNKEKRVSLGVQARQLYHADAAARIFQLAEEVL